jgi:hypothetical protein
VRREAIERALGSLPADFETHRVPWRGRIEKLPVIRIPLEALVLNPTSHRIKSQLESAPEARRAIEEDPDGEAAQAEIAVLLRATDRFDDLRQNLSDEEQREPGIVTRTGRLINGNTRAVALRDLGEEHMDVAVLPADATLGELYDLELDLQVAQDYRQDYSFTNELLFVDDLISLEGRNEEEVAERLRWATPTKPASMKRGAERVRRYVRHLTMIREIQEMSGGAIPLTDFDDAEQALQELDKAYESLRAKDPVAAERLKAARTLGLLVELGYSRQRSVDAGWVEDYLDEAFEEDPILGDVLQSVAEREGGGDGGAVVEGDLAAFEETDPDAGEEAPVHAVVGLLSERMSRSAEAETVTLPTPEGEREFKRADVREAIFQAMSAAVEDKKRAHKAGTELDRPIAFAEEAAQRLVRAREAYEVAAGRPGFDEAQLRTAIEKAARGLDALKQSVDG